MIKLPNELIAISSSTFPYPILIAEPTTYSVVKEIKEEGYIISDSSLCVLDKHSAIYVYSGNVVQIAIDNGFIICYKTKKEQELDGRNGIVSIKGGQYFIVTNNYGFTIVKPYYY